MTDLDLSLIAGNVLLLVGSFLRERALRYTYIVGAAVFAYFHARLGYWHAVGFEVVWITIHGMRLWRPGSGPRA